MQENKKTKTVVVVFLLIIVIVSGLVMVSLYKKQSATVKGTSFYVK
jgi:hypothetical protein